MRRNIKPQSPQEVPPEIVTLTPKFRDNTFNQSQVTFVADPHSAIIAKGD
ncbi:hypothetical protein MMK51_001342 [Proteus mirabilis]|nr:hypothetical protein [Proteus mirabilis]MCS6724638.1 hypothetical protein [Proteus mirabilis]